MSVEQRVNYELELSGATAASTGLNGVASNADMASGKMGSLSNSFAVGAIKVSLLVEALQIARNALALYTDLVRDTIAMGIESQTENRAFAGVFQEFSGVVTAELQNIATNAGYSNDALRELAIGVQDFLVPMGVARGEAAQMSVTMLRLATDIAAFRGGTVEEVMAAMQSGFAGASKPLLRYGIDLRAASVEQELLNMGIRGGAQAATAAELAQARLNIVTRQSADSHGAAAASLESVDGMVRQLEAKWRDLQDSMGDAWMPLLEELMPTALELFNELGPILSDVLGMTAEMGAIFLPRILDILKPLVDYLGFWHDSNMLVFNGIADGLNWLQDLEDATIRLVTAEEEVVASGSDFADSIKLRIIELQLQNTEVTYTIEQLQGMKNALVELGFFELEAAAAVDELNARIAIQKGDMSSLKTATNDISKDLTNYSTEALSAAIASNQLAIAALNQRAAMEGASPAITSEIERLKEYIKTLNHALVARRDLNASGVGGVNRAATGPEEPPDPKEEFRGGPEEQKLQEYLEAQREMRIEAEELMTEALREKREERFEMEMAAEEAMLQDRYELNMYFANQIVGVFSDSWEGGFDDVGKNFKKMLDKMMKELAISGVLSAFSSLAGGGAVGLFGKILGGGK